MRDSLAHGARLVLLSLALQQAPGAPGMGTCEEEEFLTLNMDVVDSCGVQPPRCDERVTCHTAAQRAVRIHACYAARRALALRCFDKGRTEQKRELEALEREERRCSDLLTKGVCRADDKEDKRPDPAPPPFTLDSPPTVASLKPPGDCPKTLYRTLNRLVGEHCKTVPMSCKDGEQLSCPTLKLYIERFEACIKSRRLLMETCFRGGDSDHNEHLKNARGGQGVCVGMYVLKCGPDPRCK